MIPQMLGAALQALSPIVPQQPVTQQPRPLRFPNLPPLIHVQRFSPPLRALHSGATEDESVAPRAQDSFAQQHCGVCETTAAPPAPTQPTVPRNCFALSCNITPHSPLGASSPAPTALAQWRVRFGFGPGQHSRGVHSATSRKSTVWIISDYRRFWDCRGAIGQRTSALTTAGNAARSPLRHQLLPVMYMLPKPGREPQRADLANNHNHPAPHAPRGPRRSSACTLA